MQAGKEEAKEFFKNWGGVQTRKTGRGEQRRREGEEV